MTFFEYDLNETFLLFSTLELVHCILKICDVAGFLEKVATWK